ncbi:MAG: hypothetical protein M3O46_08240 [Myxococcota bacterium]|nr:hypothetical protein [Myxococcota bacterium]
MSARRLSVWTLRTSELLAHAPHEPPSVRAQTAIVLTVADALERQPPSSGQAAALREQLVEELARLGSRIEEAGLGAVRG